MGGSPKRGGSNGGGGIMTRGRVTIMAVLALQLVLVLCFMKAPRLSWSSAHDGVDDSTTLDESSPAAVNRGSWLWHMFSSTASNCTDSDGRVVTEAVKGSSIKCTDRRSLLRMKWIAPKRNARDTTPAVLRNVNATTVFRNSHGVNAGLREPGRAREGNARTGSTTVGDWRERRDRGGVARTGSNVVEDLRERRARGRFARTETTVLQDLGEARAREGNARTGSTMVGDWRERRDRGSNARTGPNLVEDLRERGARGSVASTGSTVLEDLRERQARGGNTRIGSTVVEDLGERRARGGVAHTGSNLVEDLGGRRARGRNARTESTMVGDLRPGRVHVGRDLPTTGDLGMVRESGAAARETKGGSWQLRREFAANIRSSLERDGLRSRGHAVSYGDQLLRSNSSGDLQAQIPSTSIASVHASTANASVVPVARVGANASDSVAPDEMIRWSASTSDAPVAAANVSASIAPFARIGANVSDSVASLFRSNVSAAIAPVTANVSDAVARVTRIQPSALGIDNQRPGEEEEDEPEEEELVEEADPDVAIARSAVGFGGRRGRLPPLNNASSAMSDTNLTEISSRNTSLKASTLEVLQDVPVRNASLNATSESLKQNSTRSGELELVASPLSAALNATLGNTTDAIARSNATLANATTEAMASSNATCSNGLIYVYALPKRFNTELLENCSQLLAWGDRCQELSNAGLGPALATSPLPKQKNSSSGALATSPLSQQENSSSGPWYGTDQFNGEVIFHTRILAHPCRTHNPELATAFYVPYYGGLDVARFLFNITNKKFTSVDRDKLGTDLVTWLSRSPYWKRHQGLDHFLFLGRITWDFRRSGGHGWGSGLLHKAEMANMTKLTLERDTWDKSEMAIPYPTAFHPRNDTDVVEWQQALRTTRRDLLFSFAGQKRHKIQNDFRVALLEQCEQAKSCAVLDCSLRKCEDDALAATKFFVRSTFCLQPRGDSFTRRSIFDALIAGCIPVFFWTKSAYLQYHWHLPSDHRSYSVFIPKQDLLRGVRIEDVLSRIPPAKVRQMQENVIQLIPSLVYSQGLVHFRDAFDTSVDMAMANFQLRLHRNATQAAAAAPARAAMIPRPALAARARAW